MWILANRKESPGKEAAAEERRIHAAATAELLRGQRLYPWWSNDAPGVYERILLARTALPDGRHGPIVDLGAVGNLAGDRWALEQARRAKQHGYSSSQRRMKENLNVSGVGNGSQRVEWQLTVPVAITELNHGTLLDDFTVPIIPNSDVPGLWGLDSISAKRGLVDTFSDPPKMYLCGPGGYKVELSPGSRTYELARAPSGHLILPTSEFDKVRKKDDNMLKQHVMTEPNLSTMHLPVDETTDHNRESTAPLRQSTVFDPH
jgi:hypothetical protein